MPYFLVLYARKSKFKAMTCRFFFIKLIIEVKCKETCTFESTQNLFYQKLRKNFWFDLFVYSSKFKAMTGNYNFSALN